MRENAVCWVYIGSNGSVWAPFHCGVPRWCLSGSAASTAVENCIVISLRPQTDGSGRQSASRQVKPAVLMTVARFNGTGSAYEGGLMSQHTANVTLL